MRIKSPKVVSAIYDRAQQALDSKKASDASAAISLYINFYENQDFGNGNNLLLPYITAFNINQDCYTVPESQYKLINDLGLSKITEIKDALEQVITTLRTRKLIIIGVISLLISIAASICQYQSYNTYYEAYEKNYDDEIEKLSKAEAILNAAEKISESDLNSAYHVAGCIKTYNSEAANLGLTSVEGFSYDAAHRDLFTGKVVEKAIENFQSVKINLYAYVAKEHRKIQPITTYQILKQTIWDHIIASLFQIIGYIGSLCSIFDFLGKSPFKRKKKKMTNFA